jgi:prevent-host-death family protein
MPAEGPFAVHPDGLLPAASSPSTSPWLEAAKMVTNEWLGMPEVVASQVSVRDLKTHLSEWLGRVQAGEVVEVTSHRKPIARITAVRQTEPVSTNPLQKAINIGIVSWNGQKPNLLPPVKLRGKGKLMSDIVIEDLG